MPIVILDLTDEELNEFAAFVKSNLPSITLGISFAPKIQEAIKEAKENPLDEGISNEI